MHFDGGNFCNHFNRRHIVCLYCYHRLAEASAGAVLVVVKSVTYRNEITTGGSPYTRRVVTNRPHLTRKQPFIKYPGHQEVQKALLLHIYPRYFASRTRSNS